jgi:hypothetical protein
MDGSIDFIGCGTGMPCPEIVLLMSHLIRKMICCFWPDITYMSFTKKTDMLFFWHYISYLILNVSMVVCSVEWEMLSVKLKACF